MDNYSVEFTNDARRFINRLAQKHKTRILKKIYELPDGVDVVKMKGFKKRYRMRVGDYRVVYEIYKDRLVVLVVEIDKRGDIY
ncbi:MAG: type II toxin-antitoxin system RelE/ParE family toxin [Clostridiales bacterium]|jgi:mRNA interferase RelE/StbE|nr:type II toxin-antitoxin system RelE/ParE family toxin [Clostridiales bacterium]